MPAVKRPHPVVKKRVADVPFLPLGPLLRLPSRVPRVHWLNKRLGQCSRRKDRAGSRLLAGDKIKEWP